jgi:branched-chain amino acid transport system permease protein
MGAPDAATAPYRFLKAQTRWRVAEIVFWLATLLPLLVPGYLLLATQIAITALFALSIDLVLGYAGIVTLGHAAFFGLGAYSAGLFSKFVWSEPITGLAFGAAVAALAGYLSSLVVVRFRHLAIIMITMGFGLLIGEAANKAHWLTGGTDGLQGVQIGNLLGVFEFDLWGYTGYCYALVLLFLLFLAVRRLIHSPFGLALRGIRESWTRMPAIGASSLSHLRKAYTLSAAIAGVAGALLTQTTQTVSLDVLSFGRSADAVIMLVLGGTGRLYGGIVGAIIFMVARDQFSDINPQLWFFPIGLLLVLVVLFLPGGVLGALDRIENAWARAQAEGRRFELGLRSGGVIAVLLSVIAWLLWFGHLLLDPKAITALPCLVYPTAQCAVAASAGGYVACGPILLWLGVACLLAGSLIAGRRQAHAKRSPAPLDRGAAP